MTDVRIFAPVVKLSQFSELGYSNKIHINTSKQTKHWETGQFQKLAHMHRRVNCQWQSAPYADSVRDFRRQDTLKQRRADHNPDQGLMVSHVSEVELV